MTIFPKIGFLDIMTVKRSFFERHSSVIRPKMREIMTKPPGFINSVIMTGILRPHTGIRKTPAGILGPHTGIRKTPVGILRPHTGIRGSLHDCLYKKPHPSGCGFVFIGHCDFGGRFIKRNRLGGRFYLAAIILSISSGSLGMAAVSTSQPSSVMSRSSSMRIPIPSSSM